MRVNQRNYEESYIDNPEGDEQQDVLILGVHDRNRALHGDVVVLRLKERNEWVVRDALYYAWRTGHLNMTSDDNGQPISVPPIKSPVPKTVKCKGECQVIIFFRIIWRSKKKLNHLFKRITITQRKLFCMLVVKS